MSTKSSFGSMLNGKRSPHIQSPPVTIDNGKRTPQPSKIPSLQKSEFLQQRIEEREKRLKIFQSKQYTGLISALESTLSSQANLERFFPETEPSRFSEIFELIHKAFQNSRVQNHKSKSDLRLIVRSNLFFFQWPSFSYRTSTWESCRRSSPPKHNST